MKTRIYKRDVSTFKKFCMDFPLKPYEDEDVINLEALEAIYNKFKPVKRASFPWRSRDILDHGRLYITADGKDMILSAPYVHECYVGDKELGDRTCHIYEVAKEFSEKYGYDLTIYYPDDAKRWYAQSRATCTLIFVSKETGPLFPGIKHADEGLY